MSFEQPMISPAFTPRVQILLELMDLNEDQIWKDVLKGYIEAEGMGLSRVTAITIDPVQYMAVMAVLERGLYKLDPWLHPTNRPYTNSDIGHTWILYNPGDNPGEILGDSPILDLNQIETAHLTSELWQPPKSHLEMSLEGATVVRQLKPEEAEELLKKEPGVWKYTGKWKGLVELTKYARDSQESEEPITPEGEALPEEELTSTEKESGKEEPAGGDIE